MADYGWEADAQRRDKVAAFPWNLQGYVFQEGVTVLIAAYHAASEALREEWERAKEEAQAYQDGVDRGEIEWIGERDEDGSILWDQEQVHDLEIESKVEGMAALRKAFALSIYHHWERGARKWTGNDVNDHDKLVRAVEAIGIPISPRLKAVKDLANLLKHDNDKRGDDLLESWPQVFRPGFKKGENRTDWYGAINLTDAQLTEVFNIVAKSGPDEKTVYVSA